VGPDAPGSIVFSTLSLAVTVSAGAHHHLQTRPDLVHPFAGTRLTQNAQAGAFDVKQVTNAQVPTANTQATPNAPRGQREP